MLLWAGQGEPQRPRRDVDHTMMRLARSRPAVRPLLPRPSTHARAHTHTHTLTSAITSHTVRTASVGVIVSQMLHAQRWRGGKRGMKAQGTLQKNYCLTLPA